MALSSDLPTLETLHTTLKDDVESAHSIISNTGTSLDSAVWESPNAESFRTAWDEFRPKLWSAWCFSDWGSFSSRESIGWRPCQQRNTPTSSRPKWCVR